MFSVMSTTKSDESDSDEVDENKNTSDGEGEGEEGDGDGGEDNDEDEEDDDDESKQIVKMVFRKSVATTQISILIESLVKNLCTMIEKDEQSAKKIYITICNKLFEMKLIDESYQMTEFEGIRNQYQKALYHLVTAARNTEDPVTVHSTWPNFNPEWSQYQRDFEEIEFIAGGGFGQVFRVRHKLDGSEYAVKKIYIRANGISSVKNYLSEVKTFASLNHSNIVQYKAAWLELGIPSTKKAIELIDDVNSDISFSNETYDKNTKNSEHYHTHFESFSNESFDKNVKDTSDFTVEFESHKSKHYSYSNNNISSSKSGKKRRNRSRNSISEGGKAICKFNVEDAPGFETHQHKWATLFIQMSLCQITLKQWLEKRNKAQLPTDTNEAAIVRLNSKVRRETIIEIFQQLLCGLKYIHSKGIVHHDIKPSNIFLQMDGGGLCVQLGDFGLACPLQNSQHSLALGTKLYAAPEQLNGKCDPKSDMYSLGIVLLELVEAFSTDMERVHHITELRKGRLSSQISAQDPQLAHIISQLVTKVPHLRPESSELLTRLVEPTADAEEIRNLRSQLKEKDTEIDKLKEMLKKAGINC